MCPGFVTAASLTSLISRYLHTIRMDRLWCCLRFSGAYSIVDNGYLDWSCTVLPYGVTNNIDKIHWSKWLKSIRKDVECTFGILKGRWRMLKSGVKIHGVDLVDNIWFTCCALHNWLLDVDGLGEEWAGGICKI